MLAPRIVWPGLLVALAALPPSGPASALFEYAGAAVATAGSSRAVAVAGSSLYLGDGLAGVRSFDASDSSAPAAGVVVDTPGFAVGITLTPGRAFVADYRSGLRILNIEAPLAPFEVGANENLGDVWAVAVVEGRAYVVDGLYGVRVVDVSNESAPVEDHGVPLEGCLDVTPDGEVLYAACLELQVLDVSAPDATPVLASLPLPARALSVVVAGDLAYVVCQNVGVVIVDVSDPAAPSLQDFEPPPGGQIPKASDLVHLGDRLVVAERDFGLHLLDLAQPASPTPAGVLEIPGSVDALAVSGVAAFVASGAEGLRIADIRPACADGFDNDDDGDLDFPADPGCEGPDDPAEELACADGLDNDGDGFADGDDIGCSGADDDDERTELACDDGRDDDGDGLIDLEDPGCEGVFDQSERAPELVCDDGLDNDGDGATDYPADGDCEGPTDFSESPRCSDGVDNDGDGPIDHPEDPGCTDPDDDSERLGTVCDNGLDEDGDGAFDFPDDPGCSDIADDSELDPSVACDDGLDNDGDGLTDFPDDPGCADLRANLEDPACDNGFDDDGDGAGDFPEDGGCASASDVSESYDCGDGIDNDGDGAVDFGADFGCESPTDASERTGTVCDDGIDNDEDGLTDLEDPGCLSIQSTNESPACNDGVDNDGDALVDFPDDPGCSGAFDETESGGRECDDGVDNDGDGAADYPEDTGCSAVDDPSEIDPTVACDDGVDNDGDGAIDFPDDLECETARQGYEAPACNDGLDNDGDGRVDGEDPGCGYAAQTLEAPACDDGNDNDGDGLVDLDDPECEAASDFSEWLLDPGDVVIVQPRVLTRVAAATGRASVLADSSAFVFLGDAVLAAPGRLFVSDLALGSVFEVDPETGEETEIATGFDLGGSVGSAVGGGLDVDASGLLLVAAADGLYAFDPDDPEISLVVEGTPGAGFIGNLLDVCVEPEETVLFSRFETIDGLPSFEVVRFDPATGGEAGLWSAEPALGPGLNGSLALAPDGGFLVSQAGVVSRLREVDGVWEEETAESALGGFGGISEDVGGGLLVLEHCGDVGEPGCLAGDVRVVDAVLGETIPGGALAGPGLELIVVPRDCEDGLDGDGDSLIDDLDPDCVASFGLSEWPSNAVPEPAAALLQAFVLVIAAALRGRRRRRSARTGA